MMRTYEPQQPISAEDAHLALTSEDPARICNALLRLSLFSADWRSAQDLCVRFMKHQDAGVRGMAATCLGHLARLHRTLDLHVVIPALEALLKDPLVSGRVQDALDDIGIFTKPNNSL